MSSSFNCLTVLEKKKKINENLDCNFQGVGKAACRVSDTGWPGSPSVHLFPSPQRWDCRHAPPFPSFIFIFLNMGSGDLTQVRQTLYQLSNVPNLLFIYTHIHKCVCATTHRAVLPSEARLGLPWPWGPLC